MARKGIHPLMRTMTVVLRNGSSFRASTVLNRHTPWKLQVDTTSHPFWTGEETGISVEGARMARIMERYGDLLKTPAEKAAAAKKAAEEEASVPAASA
ncbi:hypothetical protein ACKKBF_B17775 [Auxenochlorella protothecoides x Auxenochlorella symbiontica]